MAEERLVEGNARDSERAVEFALRPKSLDEFVGQHRVREQISVLVRAASARSAATDHILLSGAPGLGKTTLAMIIAAEMSAPIRISSGPAIQHAGDLAAILSSLSEGEVLFLDEIHRMSRPAEELLYLAMEDFRVDVVVGKGPGSMAIPIDLPRFTLIGATTRAGLLPSPLRDRFGFTALLDFYEDDEIHQVLRRSASLLQIDAHPDALALISRRSRGTPRVANRLLRRVRDFAEVHGRAISEATTQEALALYEVDQLGLDRLDRSVLEALVYRFDGGPVGLSTLAVAVGEEAETIASVAEPFLVRTGLIVLTPRGRVATPSGFSHVGRAPIALDLRFEGGDFDSPTPAP